MKMRFWVIAVLWVLGFMGVINSVWAQKADRFQILRDRLEVLSVEEPGLKNKVQLALNGVTVPEFLTALAKANSLNINIDPRVTGKVMNNFNNVSASNVLVFLAQNFNLEITFIGSIMNVAPYIDPNLNVHPPKSFTVQYEKPENALTLEVEGDSLYLVAKKITMLSGQNLIVPPSLQGKKVTAFLSKVPMQNALQKLAYGNGMKLARTNDNFYLFEPLEENEELYVNGENNTSVRKVFKSAGSAAATSLGILTRTLNGQKLISLDATNANIQELVKTAASEMGRNYFLYTELKGSLTSRVNDITFDNFLSALFQGTEYTFRVENGIYLIGDRKLEGLRANRVIQLQNRSIDTVQAMIPAEWKKGVEIKEFREQNTLLLSGSGPQIQELENYIHQLDQLVPMIMIEVTLVDINKNNTTSTGLKFGNDSTVKRGGTVLPAPSYTFGAPSINNFLSKLGNLTSLNLGQVGSSFYATINALQSKTNADIHSVPRLTTLNGHTATLSIGSTEYYQIQTQNVIPSVSSPTSIFTQQYNKVDANLVINIKPVVSGNDQVTLGIKIEITDFIGTPPTNAPPPTSTSKFESIIRAHDGDMIVLGGLERAEEDDNSSGVPLLSKIPVLKWIFSSKSKSHIKKVTLVFIKPTIIR